MINATPGRYNLTTLRDPSKNSHMDSSILFSQNYQHHSYVLQIFFTQDNFNSIQDHFVLLQTSPTQS